MLTHNKHEGRSTGDIKNNSNIVNYYRACTRVCVSALANLLQMMLGLGISHGTDMLREFLHFLDLRVAVGLVLILRAQGGLWNAARWKEEHFCWHGYV